MERLHRFRRTRKDGPGAPGGGDTGHKLTLNLEAAKTVPSLPMPAVAAGEQPSPSVATGAAAQRPGQKLKAFLRPSQKRARASPPAALQVQIPATPVAAHDGGIEHPLTPVQGRRAEEREREEGAVLPIPSFLNQSRQEIDAKFQEIVWLERSRQMESISNPEPEFRWARLQTSATRGLDRYHNIQPWKNNRVKLKVPDGQQDYINASPITLTTSRPDGTRQPDRYIAMQGPNEATSGHVWRMVTEQLTSPGVIVMLTQTHEANLEKCYQYFPKRVEDTPLEINEHDEFGDGFRASVRCEAIEETPAGAAIELRKLVVRIHQSSAQKTADEHVEEAPMTPPQTEDGDSVMLSPQQPANGSKGNSPDANVSERILKRLSVSSQQDTLTASSAGDESQVEERVVWHFLYKKWPDFGVPALEDLDSFFTLMRLSRERNSNPDNPRIVHCSAGVGRSGTFIALEHLMRELDDGVLEHWDSRPPSSNSGGSRPNEEPVRNAEDTPLAAVSEKDDLIFTVVNQLREQRRHMVQAEAQYLFLYQVMRKLWQDKYGAPEEDEPAAKRLEVDPFVDSA